MPTDRVARRDGAPLRELNAGAELPCICRQDDSHARAARAACDHGFLIWCEGILAISRLFEDHFRHRDGSGACVLRMSILVDGERFARGGASPRSAAAPYCSRSTRGRLPDGEDLAHLTAPPWLEQRRFG